MEGRDGYKHRRLSKGARQIHPRELHQWLLVMVYKGGRPLNVGAERPLSLHSKGTG